MQRLTRSHMLVIARVLRQIPHALANLDVVVHDVVPEDGGAAGRGFGESQQQFDGGGLARAIGTEESERWNFWRREIERLERCTSL